MELAADANLPMPKITDGDDTIFEFVVNEKGNWEHWADRVSGNHAQNPPA